jgi:triosephosphate isomerase
MPRKTTWIGTSWKMNKTRPQARAFARELAASRAASCEAARCFVIPAFTSIADVAAILENTRVRVGAQNMHWADAGAWTGEISAAMIKDVGASLVEIGHSERREHFGDTDETVALKTKAAVAQGLLALVCVGETRAEYDAGRTSEVLARQVRAALSGVDRASRDKVVVAYEPVWSIGEGGVPADPEFADQQHRVIKEQSLLVFPEAVEVVYGGSVNAGNCRELATRPHIDGLFIGRAAWEASGFISIVESVVSALRE